MNSVRKKITPKNLFSRRELRQKSKESTRNPDEVGHIRREAMSQVVGMDRKTFDAYKDAADKKKPFTVRVKRFLLAESRLGRRAKVVKDFALLFFPWGKTVSSATELITEVLSPEQDEPAPLPQSKQTLEIMRIIEWLRARLRERSTQAALVIIVAGAAFFGLSLDVVILTEALDGLLTAVSGVITAIAILYEMFRKEKPDEEA